MPPLFYFFYIITFSDKNSVFALYGYKTKAIAGFNYRFVFRPFPVPFSLTLHH